MTPASAVHAFPVSVKGVAVQDGRLLLLENERAEWELPGGKLEIGEDPPACLVREIGVIAALFTRSEVPNLKMPDGYKRSIMTWFGQVMR